MESKIRYLGDVKDSVPQEAAMTHEEKRAWVMLVVAVIAYASYAAIVLSRADGRALREVPYAAAMLWTIGGAIVANIAIDAVVGGSLVDRRKDVRDREIGWLGDRTGQAFVVIGALSAMLMAMAGWDRFWIANVIYLCFVLSAVLGSVTKVIVYRKDFPQW
jgi:hypothetical protein